MKKRNIVYLTTYLILAIITLTASLLAWNTLSKHSESGGINSNIPNFSEMISFQVKRKSDNLFYTINESLDIEKVFGNSFPGEKYEFHINIINELSTELNVNIFLPGFNSELRDTSLDINDFNMLDIFFIEELEENSSNYIETRFFDKSMINNIDDFTNKTPINILKSPGNLSPNNSSELIKHDQLLKNFRLSNLVNNNTLNIIDSNIPVNKAINVSFTLVYDPNTENILYQHFLLSFEGIYIYSEQV